MKPLLLCAALVAAIPQAANAIDFSMGRMTGLDPMNARSVAVGDLNWDGMDDLAVFSDDTSDGVDKLRIFLQQRDGTLVETSDTLWSSAFSPKMVITDIDRDAINELIVGSASGFERIYFTAPDNFFYIRHVGSDYGCADLAVGDLDADRYPEVVCQSLSSGATVFHNDQRGEFLESAAVATTRLPATTITLGDLTGDGKPDLLLSAPDMDGFAVHPHNGTWSLGAASAYQRPSAAKIGASAIGDLDHDGSAEAVVASFDFAPGAAFWRYRPGDGGRLAAPLRVATKRLPTALLVKDLDRDGRDDIVVGSASGYGIGYHLRGGPLYVRFGGDAVFAGDSNSIAAGDLDDDGCTDIAYTTTTGGVAIAHGANCTRPRMRGDFDGDGKADLAWRNDATGAGTIWKAADSARQQKLAGVTDHAWRIVGNGDFNGDGKADLLWHHDVTGASVVWFSGNYATRQSLTRITDPAWHIVGIGDFNGDRVDDVLWRNNADGRNVAWRSGNSNALLAITAVTNLDWQVAAVADFDGDARDDIFWRDPTSWKNIIWRSGNANSPLAAADMSDRYARLWTGDYNGDRRADLLWILSNGDFYFWLKPDGSEGINHYPMESPDWRVVATGDYDGNTTSDVLWRNMRTGANVVWRSGSQRATRDLTPVTDFYWTVQR